MAASKSKAAALSAELLLKFRTNFAADPKNLLAQNACSKFDPNEICLSRNKLQTTHHVFTHKIEAEGKPITNQKNSGRCWIFAALNVMRIPFIKHFNLEDFEFSQGYLFFYDKVERANFFLHNVVETARRGEAVDGRLVSFLLHDPTCDGGQWDMLVSLVNKYGLMPKKSFPESFSCESSVRMNAIIKSKLREYAKVLRTMVDDGKEETQIEAEIERQMESVFRIVGICLGVPASTFTWEYYDKSKAYNAVGPLTPQEFYQKHVCLVTDPRPSNPYGRAYTVDCLGNVVGGRPIVYNNQPVELLARLAADSIRANEAVCHDYELVFGVEVNQGLSKADRLLYGESMMTHAMVFTAVSLEGAQAEGKPQKWRVENSWGDDRGEKGYIVMSQDWFAEYVFEVVVDKKFVPSEVLEVFSETPHVLPAWDPMGTLAKC
ncbi:hypothetical protein B566_EDAN004298 [Ephemera danica]|nr:hypothetical protein B566_EDAN004298 [Ephemera danica]